MNDANQSPASAGRLRRPAGLGLLALALLLGLSEPACAAALPNCTAWQLGQPASLAASPDCALLKDAIVASSSSRVCNSSVMVPAERVGRTKLSGVWMQHGDLSTLTRAGFLVGADLVIQWSVVEPADGVFECDGVAEPLAVDDRDTTLALGGADPLGVRPRGSTKVGHSCSRGPAMPK